MKDEHHERNMPESLDLGVAKQWCCETGIGMAIVTVLPPKIACNKKKARKFVSRSLTVAVTYVNSPTNRNDADDVLFVHTDVDSRTP